MTPHRTYVVAFSNGSSGSMLLALIERLTNPEITRPFWFTKWGNAHLCTVRPGIVFDFDKVKFNGHADESNDWWGGVVPIVDVSQPLYIQSHFYDTPTILNHFPNAKIFVITHTDSDSREIAINSVFKFMIGEWNGRSSELARRVYDWIRGNCPHLFTSSKDIPPEKLTKTELNGLVEIYRGDLFRRAMHMVTIPEEYKDIVVEIKYRDIIDDPEKVLNTLSQATGYEVTDFVRAQYAAYLDKHREFKQTTQELLT
jgi:hypothetical protein